MSTITSPGKNKDQVRTPGNQGQETADKDKAKDTANGAVDRVKEGAGSAAQQVSNVASAVGEKADQLASGAGTGIKNLGATIKENGPQEGTLGSASKAVGNTLEKGGKYIEEAGLSGIMDDLGELIKRNPLPSVMVGLGLGILLGRVFRS